MPRAPLIVLLLLLTFSDRVRSECQCPPVSSKDQTELATYIFNGEIWDVEFDKNRKKIATIDVTDTFKGDPKSRLELKDAEEGKACALDFHEGEAYVVFARWQWGSLLTSRCWGSKKLDTGVDTQNLGPGEVAKFKYYEQLQIYCMGRPDTSCCIASLNAMKKGRYLPQPENGCPEETVPDRLRCLGSYVWCVPATDLRR